MNNMTFGRYSPYNTFTHKVDPRNKILLLILLLVSLAAWASPVVPKTARAVDKSFPRAVMRQLLDESADLTADTSYTVVACGSYTWNGTTYTESGDYTYSYTVDNDSTQVDTLHLTILHGTHNSETETACESYEWHGEEYTQSGYLSYVGEGPSGCPHTEVLLLTINHSS